MGYKTHTAENPRFQIPHSRNIHTPENPQILRSYRLKGDQRKKRGHKEDEEGERK